MLTTTFVAMALALGLDQASKAVVIRSLAEGQSAGPLGSPVRLYRLSNARPGLGFVVSRRAWLLLWGCIALMVAMLSLARAGGDPIGPLGLGLALGGATGNLLDRLGRGAVVDFIDLRVWNLRIWPVFNLADVAIVGGAMLALWSLR